MINQRISPFWNMATNFCRYFTKCDTLSQVVNGIPQCRLKLFFLCDVHNCAVLFVVKSVTSRSSNIWLLLQLQNTTVSLNFKRRRPFCLRWELASLNTDLRWRHGIIRFLNVKHCRGYDSSWILHGSLWFINSSACYSNYSSWWITAIINCRHFFQVCAKILHH